MGLDLEFANLWKGHQEIATNQLVSLIKNIELTA
jgi:hypothetical protein